MTQIGLQVCERPCTSPPAEDFSFANNRADAGWLARYRQIAVNLRGNDIFEDFVRQFIVILHSTPICRREAEIADLEKIAMGIVEMRAEDNGQRLEEWQLAEIAAAPPAEATLRVAHNPTAAGTLVSPYPIAETPCEAAIAAGNLAALPLYLQRRGLPE